MPNQFKGQVLDTPAGNKLEGVKVTINGLGIPDNSSTTTDTNGEWLITLKVDIDPKDVTISFSKPGLETTSVTNPQQTATIPGYIDPIKGGILDLAGDYPSGKWKVTSLPQEMQDVINKEIQDAYTFAKSNPGNFDLKIYSSESQVPNADNEEGSNKDFTKRGSLAKARAENLKEYIDIKINELYAKEINPRFKKPTVSFGEIDRVGDTKWDGINSNDNKYTKDQYTRLKASFLYEKLDEKNCGPFKVSKGALRAGQPQAFIKEHNDGYIRFRALSFPDRFGIQKAKGGPIEWSDRYEQSQGDGGDLRFKGFTAMLTSNFTTIAVPQSSGALRDFPSNSFPPPANFGVQSYSPSEIKKFLIRVFDNINENGFLSTTSQTEQGKIYNEVFKEFKNECATTSNPERVDANCMADKTTTKYGTKQYIITFGTDTSYKTFNIQDIPDGETYYIHSIPALYDLESSYQYSICKVSSI